MSCFLRLCERPESQQVMSERTGSAASVDGRASSSPAHDHALLVLLAKERPRLLAFVRKRVRSGADAEDLLQQALTKAVSSLGGVRDESKLLAWFYRVLRNTISDHHAEWARREEKLELLAREASEAPPEDAAVCGCSLGVLAQLPPAYAAILRQIDIEEEPLAEVAQQLAITPTNAKVRLFRARRALREALRAYCGTDSAKACLSCDC